MFILFIYDPRQILIFENENLEVSMRAGRAKPRPSTRGGGAGHRRRCGEEAHRLRGAVMEEAGVRLDEKLEAR
jgi:hypothetical protein